MSNYYKVDITTVNGGYESIDSDYIITNDQADAMAEALRNAVYGDDDDMQRKIKDYQDGDSYAIEYEEMAHSIYTTNKLKPVEYRTDDGVTGIAVLNPINNSVAKNQSERATDDKPYLVSVLTTLHERDHYSLIVVWAKDDHKASNEAIIQASYDLSNYDDHLEALAEIEACDDNKFSDSVGSYMIDTITPLEIVKVTQKGETTLDAVLIKDVRWTNTGHDVPRYDLLQVV